MLGIKWSGGHSTCPQTHTHTHTHTHTCIHSHSGGLVAKPCPTLVASWAVARQAPLSMGFSRQEYWNGLPFPSPGDLPRPGIEPGSPAQENTSVFSASVSLSLPCRWAHQCHLSRFHIHALIYDICHSLSDLPHSVGQALAPGF